MQCCACNVHFLPLGKLFNRDSSREDRCILSLHPRYSLSLFAAEQIEVEAKFIKANFSTSSIPHDFSKLNEMSGVDLLSSSHVTTTSGVRAKHESTHDFTPASVNPSCFEPVTTGFALDVIPEIKERHLTYNAHLTTRDLIGVKDENGQKLSEKTSQELYLSGTPADGEWMWIEISDVNGGQRRMICLRFTRKKEWQPGRSCQQKAITRML